MCTAKKCTAKKSKYSYWSFDGTEIKKKYSFEKFHYLGKFGDTIIFTAYTLERGRELYQINKGVMTEYPEIVKGPEGIEVLVNSFNANIFTFNNHVYVYAFTHTYGWQVWKMGTLSNGETPDDSDNILGVEKENTVKIYPNPVTNTLIVEGGQYDFTIIDALGKTMLSGSPTKSIDVSTLPKAVYWIKFSGNKQHFSKKIIKW